MDFRFDAAAEALRREAKRFSRSTRLHGRHPLRCRSSSVRSRRTMRSSRRRCLTASWRSDAGWSRVAEAVRRPGRVNL